MRFANLSLGRIKYLLSFSSPPIREMQPGLQLSPMSIQQDLLHSQEVLEQILTQNILPFWYPQVIDLEDRGYRLNHDLKGNWKGRKNKRLVTQARTLWFFSRLCNSSYRNDEYLKAARHGYEFLRNQMWDKQFGGFYWEVDSAGNLPVKAEKHLYGQAFGLYSLSEYAIASGNSSGAELTRKLFNLLEKHAHDRQYGGYRECFLKKWDPAPDDTIGYLGAASPRKLMNTHLHLLEAITMYYHLTGDPTARERLIELIFILSNTVIRKTLGACTDTYHRDWTPLSGPEYDRISYGHNIENIWLLIDACDAVGISNGPFLDLYRLLFGYASRFGFDRKNGGFYYNGSFNSRADKREKIWWIQAEGLVSALYMYRLTRDKVYWDCFFKTLNWIVTHQIDWANGDWHAQVDTKGKPSGDKAGEWKSPYHNGRAMIKCLELLQSLADQ